MFHTPAHKQVAASALPGQTVNAAADSRPDFIEHLVFLTSEDGDEAGVAILRVSGALVHALRIAASKGFRNFNVVERCYRGDTISDRRVATFRRGVAPTITN
jgi:hypothetical protein